MAKEIIIENKKAYHEYFVEETLECGVVLKGNEVKSIRNGMASIKEAWCRIQDGKLVIRGMHITKWDTSNIFDVDEDRERVLLIHKKEIKKFEKLIKLEGITIIPLKVYFSRGLCKILVGVCKGKHLYDKRQANKERDTKRQIARELKQH